MSELKIAYDCLSNIYKKGAYSNIELNKVLIGQRNSQIITKMVYGVLEKDTQLDYYVGQLCNKKPQNTILILLKLGMYCISYMNSIPNYAAVDNCVEMCNDINKPQLKGFVNSVLKKYAEGSVILPLDNILRLSVEASVPLWLIKQYVKQYGFDVTSGFLLTNAMTSEHIRVNTRLATFEGIKDVLERKNINFKESECGGFFVDYCADIKEMFEDGLITLQSKTSIECCKMMKIKDNDKVLDLCAAPGGKSILINEMAQNVEVVACDIHEHRVKLIESYVARMQAQKIAIICHDAMDAKPEWDKFFDKVLCDAPCSGFGVARKKPDIYFNTSMKEVDDLSKLQYLILENAANFVADGGSLIYSTCTLLREENYNIVGRFVKENTAWKIAEYKQFLPDDKGQDGFFVAILQRV